jgi:hypothetical protein
MRFLLFSFFLFIQTTIVYSQTWSEDVAQIFYSKCANCHHEGGIGGFSLTKFEEVSPMANAIQEAINSDEMPPWPPDNSYQKFSHDRSLSSEEKITILNWIGISTPQGNPALTPPIPYFNTATLLGKGDLEVKIPTYSSKATAQHDDYVCFSIPSGLKENRIIKSIEIIPGNREIVHHALIYIDPLHKESSDSTDGNCSGPSYNTTRLIAGYTPGSTPVTLPSKSPLKLGFQIEKDANIYFAMHYPEGSYGKKDSTKVIFHFYPTSETGIREVFTAPVIQNWNFTLPPNQTTEISAEYGPLTADVSLLSVFPHMHLLGKSISSFGVTQQKDTVNFISIPNWDFHWQDFYFFKKMVKAPKGTTMKGIGLYDNTENNPENPSSPPITVKPGLNTLDEMFLVYFQYLLYQEGDENFDLESLMETPTTAGLTELPNTRILNVYPNPFSDQIQIEIATKPNDILSVFIYDANGKLVRKLENTTKISTSNVQIHWNGESDSIASVPSGVYYVSIALNGEFYTREIIKK